MEASLANNIEDALSRTRKIMEESKAITLKNLNRKNMLEEKFDFEDLKPEKEYSPNNSDIVRRISEIELSNDADTSDRLCEDSIKFKELKFEVNLLTRQNKDQALRVKFLEQSLTDANFKNSQLLQELKVLKKKHLEEIEKIEEEQECGKCKKSGNSNEISEMKQRISLLEDKYKQQVLANHELIENIKTIQNDESKISQSEKINELEDILVESLKKYKNLKERLDKTESLLEIDRTYYVSPETTLSKRSIFLTPKAAASKKLKKKTSQKKSAICKIGGKKSIHKVKA